MAVKKYLTKRFRGRRIYIVSWFEETISHNTGGTMTGDSMGRSIWQLLATWNWTRSTDSCWNQSDLLTAMPDTNDLLYKGSTKTKIK